MFRKMRDGLLNRSFTPMFTPRPGHATPRRGAESNDVDERNVSQTGGHVSCTGADVEEETIDSPWWRMNMCMSQRAILRSSTLPSKLRRARWEQERHARHGISKCLHLNEPHSSQLNALLPQRRRLATALGLLDPFLGPLHELRAVRRVVRVAPAAITRGVRPRPRLRPFPLVV